jgi:glycosyltransferase involved in cell wall biosynthesis
MENITVSVLMAAYNAERFIGEAIESVINSDFTDWELIIVDDRSTDGTYGICEKYVQINDRIRLYKNEKNLGDYPNRNKVASYANGTYLKYLDNDDVLYKYSLSYMVEAMEKFPSAALAIGFHMIDDSEPYPIFYTSQETYKAQFLGKGFLSYGPSSAIIKRDAFESTGGFVEQKFVGDQELWLRLALKHGAVKLQPSLIWYRVHTDQESNRERKNILNNDVRYKINLQSLENGKHFFTESEYQYAKHKIKQHYARFILRYAIKSKRLSNSVQLFKKSGLKFWQLLQGFKPYLK